LWREAALMARALDQDDLDAARQRAPNLVGRDSATLDQAELCRATVESVAENTSDAVVAPLLWAAFAGAAGAAGYRAANTLDAMVGHPNLRYREFGWAAARLDDLLNWPAARLTAALAILAAPFVGGKPADAWRSLRRDGRSHPSPNAGRVEAAFAGALSVRLGGRNRYHGRVESRPTLGEGRAPIVADIARAVRLSKLVTLAAATLSTAIALRRG
jgi:adenosylcobinamide-phosphate synthase